MDGWKSWKGSEGSFLSTWYQRVRESYVAVWFFGVFQSSRTMSTSTAPGGGGGGVGGALSLMGCVREASPPPQNHHQHHHHHHHQHHRTFGLGEFPATQHSVDPLPKGQRSLSTLDTNSLYPRETHEKAIVVYLSIGSQDVMNICNFAIFCAILIIFILIR